MLVNSFTTYFITDGSLELCRFTNHSESKRPSCCTHDTENELLLTAQAEYSKILHEQTTEVIDQMSPGKQLSRKSRSQSLFNRTAKKTKRFINFQ